MQSNTLRTPLSPYEENNFIATFDFKDSLTPSHPRDFLQRRTFVSAYKYTAPIYAYNEAFKDDLCLYDMIAKDCNTTALMRVCLMYLKHKTLLIIPRYI